MFKELIEEIEIMEESVNKAKSMKLTLKASKVLENIKIGDSIGTNGVRLTVANFTSTTFTVDVMPETMRKIKFGKLKQGDMVNLERELKVSDRIRGRILSRHVDGTGTIKDFKVEDNATWVIIETTPEVIKYVIPKGSVAIDGTILTVVEVADNFFRVSIIPIIKEETILFKKKVGDKVNLECDIVEKYIERFLTIKEAKNEVKQ